MKSILATLGLFAILASAHSHPRQFVPGNLRGGSREGKAIVQPLANSTSPSAIPVPANVNAAELGEDEGRGRGSGRGKGKGREPVIGDVKATITDPAEKPDATPSPILITLSPDASSDASPTNLPILNATGAQGFANRTTRLTTLTVRTTEVKTVTSCAPTITKCPSRAEDLAKLPQEAIRIIRVTNTIVLTETVCPVSEASQVSRSVIREAETGGITGHTLTKTAADSKPTPGGKEEEETTFIRQTSTETQTITIPRPGEGRPNPTGKPPGSVGESSPQQPQNPQNNGDNKGNGVCPAAVTVTAAPVTVTLPASTVFVTVGSEADKTGRPGSKGDQKPNSPENQPKPTGAQTAEAEKPKPTGAQTAGAEKPNPTAAGEEPDVCEDEAPIAPKKKSANRKRPQGRKPKSPAKGEGNAPGAPAKETPKVDANAAANAAVKSSTTTAPAAAVTAPPAPVLNAGKAAADAPPSEVTDKILTILPIPASMLAN